MAIPNNYIDKITNKDTGESRIISPAADKVRVENENFEGTDLDEVLDEVAQAIEDAGTGNGTVTGVQVGNTTYEPTEGVVDISAAIPDTSGLATKSEVTSGLADKVDKNGTDSLMTATEHTKLAGIEAGAEVNVISGIKANGASETLPVDNNGIVTLPPAGSTISPATAAPLEDGTAGVGSSEKYAREDHRHPHDTTKQDSLTFDNVPTAGSNNPVKSGGIKTALDAKADAATTYNKTEVDDAIDDKLTSVAVTEISDAADVIVINDADLAFIDEDGNIAMQVRGGHVETQNFDSRQVATNAVAIQQLQSQIEGMDGGSGNSQLDVKNDVDAALDITDDNGNVVLRVTTEGHIQTKEFDSSEQGGGSSGQSGQDEMAYFLATKMVPQCICHGRDGFSSYRANTIPYYVKAYTQGFRFFETDVITCADGAIACHLNTNGYTVYKKDDPTQTAVAISKDGILQWSAATLASDYTWTASTYTDGALTALGVPIATMQDVIKKVCHDFRCPLYMQVQDNNAGTRVAARNYATSLGVGLYLFTEVANLDAVTHSDKAGNHGFVMGSASGIQAKAQAYKTSDNNIIFCLTNSATNSIDRFTNAELKEFADTAHQYGCYCGCYTITNTDTDKARAMRLFQAGFDFATTNGIPMSSL